MKPELKRIAAALHHVAESQVNGTPIPDARSGTAASSQSYSFKVTGKPTGSHAAKTPSNTVQPFVVESDTVKTPMLPKLKPASFSKHRHSANPELATNLLKEIETLVGAWQGELHKIVQQIQDVYLEGPIVDGWLESHPRSSTDDTSQAARAKLHHLEVEHLMDYVEEVCQLPNSNVSCQSPRTGYRLCGLDQDGQLWSRPCPSDQIASVSIAIARYQRLRQLLGRKQLLEARLSQLSETLIVLHSHLKGI